MLTSGQQILLEPWDKAEGLNAFFATQCSAPASTSIPELPAAVGVDFSFTELSSGNILAELGNLHVWKYYGLDCVSPRLLKECQSELVEPLCYLFNLSLSTGVYPDQWKRSVVSPLYKQKGDRAQLSSYRPISLLSAVSKVFGHLVKKQLLEFCLNQQVIPNEQFGYLPG